MPSEQNTNALYLCYFGLREPLVQTQVLPYLREIKKINGMKISLLTFEVNFKEIWTSENIEKQKKELAAEDIDWYCLAYHKTPSVPATFYDTLAGAFKTWKLIRKKNIDVLHARVHIPALMGAIAKKLSRRKTKLIFDIRGFFPEEYTDAGSWKKNGLIYRTVKIIEKWLLKEADGFVVLTEKARAILFPESKETGFDAAGRPVEVIPCCVDLRRFEISGEQSKREIRSQYNLENRFVITYIGSFGSWYLADEMADLLSASLRQDDKTFALILTQSAPEIMTKKLVARGFTENDFLVKKASHGEIPRFLSASDAALSFIKPCYSKLSSSPTKIAEYLASGTPVVANSGVGDIEEQIEGDGVGVIIENFNQESYLEALQKIKEMEDGNLSEKCKTSALNRFDLERIGGEKYRRLYRRLLQK